MNLVSSRFLLSFFRKGFFAFALLFVVTTVFAQTTGNVFFFGIGIENSKVTGAPLKPLAKADVSAVLEKTKADLLRDHISYYSTEINKQIRFNDVVSTCLFDDKATLENIDSVFAEIGKNAKPYDIFYFYISAPCNSTNGAFYIPAKAIKKGAKTPDTPPVLLDPIKLQTLFARIACRNQLIVADAPSWKTLHGSLLTSFFQSSEKQKNQVLIVSSSLSTDTFLLANNKKVGLFSNVICTTDLSLLFSFEEGGAEDAGDQLLLTSAEITKKKQKYLIVYPSVNIVNAGTLVENNVPAKVTAAPVEDIVEEKIQEKKGNSSKSKSAKSIPETRGPISVSDQKEFADSIVTTIKNYALIIGVSEYKDSAWPDLPNPVPDAMALDKELKTNFGFETKFLANPTRDELWDAITELSSRKFDENSQLLIFFAGHGGMGAVEGYIVPADGKNPANDKTMSSYITYGYLRSVVASIKTKHLLVLIDACYSGTFDQDVLASADRGVKDDQIHDRDNLRLVREKMKYRFKGYLTSGGKETVSDGKPGENSPFMASILNCLRNGYAMDQVVTFSELSAIVGRITTPVPRWGVLSGGEPGGDFLFIPQLKKRK